MPDTFANAVQTVLSGNGGSISSVAATLNVASNTGFPAAATANGTQFRILIDSEYMIVTNVAGTTWTVSRGAESSSAATHTDGARVTHVLTAGAMGFLPYVPAATAVSGLPLGRYVGTVNGSSPTGGPYAVGDFAVDRQVGAPSLWVNTVAGSPGTWAQVSGGGGTTSTVLGNLGATHTFTNNVVSADPYFQGTQDANHTATITLAEGAHETIAFTQDGTGGRTLAFSGVDVWKTSNGSAPTITTTAGSTHWFFISKINGITYGFWLTEPSSGGVSDTVRSLRWPTSAVAESMPRYGTMSTGQTVVITGRLGLWPIELVAGTVVSNITFVSGSGGATTPTHIWFCLYDKNKNKLRVTVDDTGAWPAETKKTLALASSFTVPTTDLYLVGMVIVAGTCPNFYGTSHNNTSVLGLAPIMSASYNIGLTDPTSAPATASNQNLTSVFPYFYLT